MSQFDISFATMEPWQSWALTFVLGAAAWYYYMHSGKRTTARPTRAQSFSEESTARPARRREEVKPKRKTDGAASGKDAAVRAEKPNEANKASKKKEEHISNKTPTIVSPPEKEEQDNDKEWAHQLAGLKKGTALAPPARKDNRGKTVKQRAADADRTFASGSSTNGADADGELSPALSPSLNAVTGGVPNGRDVADMLEAPAAGPSVLRLTEPTNPGLAKKQQPKKAAPPPQETKKQRQNRKKVEEAKALREDAEKGRRVQLEKQLRTAREARGEPAKNGLSSDVAPASNAWTSKGSTAESKVNGESALLDTFNHDSVPTARSSGLAKNGGSNWERDLPSEEEQMRMAMEESGWNTVEKAKKGKKKGKDAEAGTESEQLAVKAPEVSSLPLSETSNTSRSNTMSTDNEPPNGLASSTDIGYISGNVGSHPQDSDWAVV